MFQFLTLKQVQCNRLGNKQISDRRDRAIVEYLNTG